MAAALEKLASTQVRDLLAKTHREERRLALLYHECKLAGLVSVFAVPSYELDDIKRLHSLFDVALENGMTYVIIDYLNEICHDEYAVSSDALESRLMQPEMVWDWCHAARQRIQAKVCQTSGGGLPDLLLPIGQLAESGLLCALAKQLGGLVAVMQALGSGPSGGGGAPSGELRSTLRLHHCLQVVRWCHGNGLTDQPPTGRHSSRPAWARRCSERAAALEAASSGHSPFISDLCREAAGSTEAGRQLYGKYPPPSLEHAVSGLFLQGGESDDAWRAKLAVLLYYLEDGGFMSGAASELISHFRQTFHVSVRDIKQWRVAYLLDIALTDSPDSLNEACSLLLDSGGPATSFKYASLLSKAFGRHGTALALLRAGVGQATSASLAQALGAMDIRLSCNLLNEAYLELGRHCKELAGPVRIEHRTALLQHLLGWAVKQKALNQVLELPLSPEEEATLHSWIFHGEGAGLGVPSELLSLYYVQRGRIPEALLCSPGSSQQSGAQAASIMEPSVREAFRTMLAAAQQTLPMAQRQLCAVAQADAAARPGSIISRCADMATAPVVLRCTQRPGGQLDAQMDSLPLLQAAPATGQALLGPLMPHQALPGCQDSPAKADSMQVDEVETPVSPLLGPGPSATRTGAAPPGVSANEPMDSGAGGMCRREPPRGLLFSSRAAVAGEEGQGLSQQQALIPSKEEFAAAMLEQTKKQKGRQPAKRARTARTKQ
mmetsp:Transcript_29148/g.82179  ORF Transcript_29148/g.82179 Transcript_29148/m.82179 type:complete len:721 (-) Transcript_29148:300-2462(-)|eukprot:CAMPEP_0117659690 /NCGR_PEP_ID=MMETSP0804-20121206/6566_1 /TAXON_ID=1074897 /ORGANISM="Tetraselmis astigmatica, Strain CCMP880" /LENGTH=720 /DNA_ID=CAMNT_0005466363 /DNA_START=81 /DNA_END=2243 /DNA_ORIENTATION=-